MRSGTWTIRSAAVPGVIASALALAAAACGSAPASPAHHAMTSHHAMPSRTSAAAAFGPDCAMIPASGMGSAHSMAMDPFVTAASHNPLLSTFAADARTAGLASTLDSMHAITVFAPASDAFRHLGSAAMTMMHSSAELARIVRYHIVEGRVTPADLARGMTLRTLQGGTLKASKMGAVYEVNGADVVCGNIQTANATVYVISKVLIPMH